MLVISIWTTVTLERCSMRCVMAPAIRRPRTCQSNSSSRDAEKAMGLAWKRIAKTCVSTWLSLPNVGNSRYLPIPGNSPASKSSSRWVAKISMSLWDPGTAAISSHARLQKNNLSSIANIAVRLAASCLLYTSPSPRDRTRSRMPSSA